MASEPTPLLVIGAARSGTKLLRDLVALHPSIESVPYDVNYLWRLGNGSSSHDELDRDQLDPKTMRRIRTKIKVFNRRSPIFIEKTVSNCLRVGFVRKIFPEARFLHLVRQGEDVTESAYRQWLAAPDWRYILKKTASYPILDAFGYGLRFGVRTLGQLAPFKNGVPRIWGPHYRGIRADLKEKKLLEVCAIQWMKCVIKATHQMLELGPDTALWIRYEDFVRSPLLHLEQIADFLGIDPTPYSAPDLLGSVETGNIGKGRRNLASEQVDLIRPYLEQAEALLSRPPVARKFNLV